MGRFLIFSLIICSVASLLLASRHLSVKTGSSVVILCPYDMKYIHHKKYWCFGYYFSSCRIQAYASNTQGKLIVTDNPADRLFTVTMKNLQRADAGYYWCAVEIGGVTQYDVKEDVHITVKADPDLYVKENRVTGEEGGSITVQCLYSAEYQKTQKQWCRFKNRQCNSMGKTITSQNSAVHISEDGRRSFSVQMSGLKKSDAGWYWCRAGDLQVSVHISISDPPPAPVTTPLTTPVTSPTSLSTNSSYCSNAAVSVNSSSQSEESKDHENLIIWYLVAVILVLVILILIIIGMRYKAKHQTRTEERSHETTVHTDENEIMYSSVAFKPRKQKSKQRSLNQESPTDLNDEAIYSTVILH